MSLFYYGHVFKMYIIVMVLMYRTVQLLLAQQMSCRNNFTGRLPLSITFGYHYRIISPQSVCNSKVKRTIVSILWFLKQSETKQCHAGRVSIKRVHWVSDMTRNILLWWIGYHSSFHNHSITGNVHMYSSLHTGHKTSAYITSLFYAH